MTVRSIDCSSAFGKGVRSDGRYNRFDPGNSTLDIAKSVYSMSLDLLLLCGFAGHQARGLIGRLSLLECGAFERWRRGQREASLIRRSLSSVSV